MLIRAWDSCVFISLLQMRAGVAEQGRTAEELLGIDELVSEQDNSGGVIVLAASVVTIAEVLDTKLTEETARSFRDMFTRSDIVPISIDPPVAWLARELRTKFRGDIQRNPEAKGMKTPDALILASAIICGAKEFYTFDGTKSYEFLKIEKQIREEYGVEIIRPYKDLPPADLFTPVNESPKIVTAKDSPIQTSEGVITESDESEQNKKAEPPKDSA